MDTRFFDLRMTDKQRNYLCALAREAGFSSLRDAAGAAFGWSSSKASKKAAQGRFTASDLIDALKAMIDK